MEGLYLFVTSSRSVNLTYNLLGLSEAPLLDSSLKVAQRLGSGCQFMADTCEALVFLSVYFTEVYSCLPCFRDVFML